MLLKLMIWGVIILGDNTVAGRKVILYRIIKCPNCNEETCYDEYNLVVGLKHDRVKVMCSHCGHEYKINDKIITNAPYKIVIKD